MPAKRKLFLLMIALICLCWSWLFLIDVVRLSSSKVTGYISMTAVFAIIVGISTVIFWRGSRYIYRQFIKPKPSWKSVCLIIASWAMLEFSVSWLVALFWSGRGSSFDSLLPFTSLTPLLMFTPLKYLARFTGYFGLSALVVTIIISLVVQKLRRYGAILAAVAIFASGLSYLAYKTPDGPDLSILFAANNLANKTSYDISGVDLAVVPEYGLDGIDNKNANQIFTNSDQETYYVGTQQKYVTNGVTNNLLLGSTSKGIFLTQSKHRLIAGGEYLPYLLEGALKSFDQQTYADFQVRRNVVKGDKPINPLTIQTRSGAKVILGSEACSSIISARDYRLLTRQGANILTNSASLEIFKGSRLFNIEDRGFAIFMAVANARPIVQSSNNWSAYALDHNGHLLKDIEPVNSTKLNIKSNRVKTPYTLVGEWLVWIGFAALGYKLLFSLASKKTKH